MLEDYSCKLGVPPSEAPLKSTDWHARLTALIGVLALGDGPYFMAADQFIQADTGQEILNLIGQVTPQIMRQASVPFLTVSLPAAAGGIHGFIHCGNHLGDIDRIAGAAQAIATSGSTYATHQLPASQFGKQLLQVGNGN